MTSIILFVSHLTHKNNQASERKILKIFQAYAKHKGNIARKNFGNHTNYIALKFMF